jgi:hypothetical protein
MSGMNERREVICGLSVEEAREFLAHIGEERVQHEVLHVRKGATVRQALNHISEKLDEKARRELQRARQRHQDDEMHCIRDNVRKIANQYLVEKVHEQLLADLDELDEHWRTEHPEEPELGIEYIRRVVTEVRQYPR